MASIFRRPGGSKYLIEYTGADGKRHRKTGFASLKLTQQLAARIEKEVAEGAAGMPRRRAAETIEAAVNDYVAELRRLGRVEPHVRTCAAKVLAVAGSQGWVTVDQIAPTGLARFLAAKAAAGRSGTTLNRYRDHLHYFCSWLVRHDRLARNPVQGVPRGPQHAVRPRRAFTLAELEKLCKAAPPAAARAYRVAAYSGLRRGELKKVQAGNVSRDNPKQWYWTLRPEQNKARRAEVVPMLPECRAVLENMDVENMPPGQLLFPDAPGDRAFQRHVRAAGIPKLDGRGRRVDWHSLRYTFCTVLARHLPIQHVRLLMRHRDVSLTVKVYLDLGLTDVAETLAKLPAMFRKPTEEEKRNG